MYRKLAVIVVLLALGTPVVRAQTPAEPQVYEPSPSFATDATETPRTEDWTTIDVAKSGLPTHAAGAVALSKTEEPECTRELLRVQWRPGDPIDLYVIRPRGVAKPPVVLFLYNYTWFWVTSDKVHGFVPYPDGLIRTKGMSLAN